MDDSKILKGATEALEFARGEKPAAAIWHNGVRYVPLPKGYVVVPMEPTGDMGLAGFKAWKATCFRSDVSQGDDIYKAMLAAAPPSL